MSENLKKFNELWKHVSSFWKPTPLMLEIKGVLEDFMRMEKPDLRPSMIFSDRIAKHIGWEHFRDHELVSKADGEWYITNSDLEFWANLCLFGERDFFPKKWHWLSSTISAAIHQKRRWQTLLRYYDNGGLNDDHKKLLKKLGWDLSLWRGDGVSLYVQGKRPFGNSSIEGDIIEILEWEVDPDVDEMPDDLGEKCWEIFDELQFAIFDALALVELCEKAVV